MKREHCVYLGSVRGTLVYIDIFVLPALLILYISGGMGFALLYLPAFIIHEASHLVAAYLFNYRVCTFTLLPLGGTMQLNSHFKPCAVQLTATYLFAPLVNIMLFCFIYAAGLWLDSILFMQFAFVNGFIAVFNLLPLYPLDGGNAVKAILQSKLNEQRTLRIMLAVNIVTAIAVVIFSVWAYFAHGVLMWQAPFIAVFFTYSAYIQRHDSAASCICDIVNRSATLRQSMAMASRCIYVFHTASIAKALRFASHDAVNTFRVVDDELNVIGELSEKELLAAATKLGMEACICKTDGVQRGRGARVLF